MLYKREAEWVEKVSVHKARTKNKLNLKLKNLSEKHNPTLSQFYKLR